MDYVAIILAIIFLLLAIDRFKNYILYKDNHFAQMQDYLNECERQNEENAKEDFMKYLKEVEEYDKLMKDKTI